MSAEYATETAWVRPSLLSSSPTPRQADQANMPTEPPAAAGHTIQSAGATPTQQWAPRDVQS